MVRDSSVSSDDQGPPKSRPVAVKTLKGTTTTVENRLRFFSMSLDFLKSFLNVFPFHCRVVKGAGHLGNDEVMEAGGQEFDPRPGH